MNSNCYGCFYSNRCYKPCCVKKNKINNVLVRSQEAIEKQNFCCNVKQLNKRLNNIQRKLENILMTPIDNPGNKCPCKNVMDTKLLVQSKAALDNMNLCGIITPVFTKMGQLTVS